MKAILIDPFERSLATIDIDKETVPALLQIRKLVNEDGLDFACIMRGEAIAVGDHSALADPPLPRWRVASYKHPLFGRGVLCGYRADGTSRDTMLSVDDLSKMIEFQ